jgi:hypothetical protein
MERRAEQGYLPGRAPLGYLNRREGGQPLIVPDPQKAPLVKRAFDLASNEALPLELICELLGYQGLLSRNGRPLGVRALREVLSNPFYTGHLRYKGRTLSGRHEPLIHKVLFDSVRRRLNIPSS